MAISATDTELPLPVNNMFMQTFLRQASARCPYFTGTQQGVLERHKGTASVKWQRVAALAPNTTPLGELQGTAAYGQGRTAAAASVETVTATIAKYGNHYNVSEEADLQNPNQQTDELVKSLAIAAGRSADQLQGAKAEDNLTAIYAGGVASGGLVDSVVSKTEVANAVVSMDTLFAEPFTAMTVGSQNVGTAPIMSSFYMFCHPHVAYDMTRVPGFRSIETYAGQVSPVLGEFGYIGVAGVGVRCISTQDASIGADQGNGTVPSGIRTTSSAVDLYYSVIIGKDCMGSLGFGESWLDGSFRAGDDVSNFDILLSQRMPSPADPYAELQTMAYKFWWDAAVLNSNWGRVIVSGATDLD